MAAQTQFRGGGGRGTGAGALVPWHGRVVVDAPTPVRLCGEPEALAAVGKRAPVGGGDAPDMFQDHVASKVRPLATAEDEQVRFYHVSHRGWAGQLARLGYLVPAR